MRGVPEKSSRLRESSCRVTVLVVVIGCHLGLLLLLVRPVVFYRNTTSVARDDPLVLKLHFFRLPQSPPHPELPATRLPTPAVLDHATLSAKPSKPVADQHAARIDAQPYETRSIDVPNPDASKENSVSDGGFQERLHDAQHARSIRGVPGSDAPFAPGIHFVDPMSHGIGATMRKAQRALGIKNRHCIDVDVWRQLTQQALSERHISPDDVDEVDEKYDCNRPPGLRF